MKLFLNDERTPPPDWILIRWPEEAIKILKQDHITKTSLDHDLGDDEHGTGYDAIFQIEETVEI